MLATVILFNFVIAHILAVQYTATDYLSRLETYPKNKFFMKIREDVQTPSIAFNGQSAGVTQEEQIFYTNAEDELEEQYWGQREAIRQNPAISDPTTTTQTNLMCLLANGVY